MPPARRPLVSVLQAVIERSYCMPRVLGDAGLFMIGDRGLREFFDTSQDRPLEYGARARGAGARVLVRDTEGALRLALYYPDDMVRLLEERDPRSGVDDGNIDAFAVLVEELDHLLVIASRAARRRPVTLLELELHAGVTRYLVVMHFLARLTGRRRVSEFHRAWARHHLFGKYCGGGGGAERRYREAARFAGRYVAWLEGLPVPARRAELMTFDRRGLSEQVGLIERVA